jgi:hypothetical protein
MCGAWRLAIVTAAGGPLWGGTSSHWFKDSRSFLAPAADAPQAPFEIVIGGWSNSQSVIRDRPKGPNLVTAYTAGILSATQYRYFWVAWGDGKIRVGRVCDGDQWRCSDRS